MTVTCVNEWTESVHARFSSRAGKRGVSSGGGFSDLDLSIPFVPFSEVNERGRPSKWPPECLPSKFADFECAFSL